LIISKNDNCRLLVEFSDNTCIVKEKTVKELANYYNIDLSLYNELTYSSFKYTLMGKFSHYSSFELELL